MIPVKDAVAAARAAIREYYSSDDLLDPRLEEVELSRDGSLWLITLGFYVPNRNPKRTPLTISMLGGVEDYIREYKLFEVDSQTGQVRAMKIRKV